MSTWSLRFKLILLLTFGGALNFIVGTDGIVSQNAVLQTSQTFVNAETPKLNDALEIRLRGREALGLFLQINSPKKDEIEISIKTSQQSDLVPTNDTKFKPELQLLQKRAV